MPGTIFHAATVGFFRGRHVSATFRDSRVAEFDGTSHNVRNEREIRSPSIVGARVSVAERRGMGGADGDGRDAGCRSIAAASAGMG